MSKFYFSIWIRWVLRLSVCSIFLAMLLSLFITTFIYFIKGNGAVGVDTLEALFEIWKFWVMVTWNLTLLIALFRSLKYIFNNCLDSYSFKLLECNTLETIDIVGYGDLVKIFRRWLFSLIWLVTSFVVIAVIFTKFFFSFSNISEWFNIYWLYLFLILSGFISFVILGTISKKVKVSRC